MIWSNIYTYIIYPTKELDYIVIWQICTYHDHYINMQVILFYDACAASMLCWPVGWPAKCHTKKHLFSWDNAISCMTFVAAPDMSTGLVIVTMHTLICPAFSQFVIICFLQLHCLVALFFCLLDPLSFLTFGWYLPLYYIVPCALPPLFDWYLFDHDTAHYDYCCWVHLQWHMLSSFCEYC